MSLFQRNLCQRCMIPRNSGSLNRDRICQACLREIRKARMKLAPDAVCRKLESLARMEDPDIASVAKVCLALLELTGGTGELVRSVNEFLTRDPNGTEAKYGADWDSLVAARQAIVSAAIMNMMGVLEEQAAQNKRDRMLRLKALRELSQDEYEQIILPLAGQLTASNPNFAIRALQQAGYDVTLRRKPDRKPD